MLKTDDRRLTTILLLCYITDRSQFPGNEATRRTVLLEKITEASRAGVDFIQLREKDISSRDLEILTKEALQAIHESGKTKLLINSRTDIAIACGADGVHLPSKDVNPAEVMQMWRQQQQTCGGGRLGRSTISISCHTPAEVNQAVGAADLALFAPVFEKTNQTPAGLKALTQACKNKIPVLALGGITLENAKLCRKAGAGGIAAIRLFQQNEISRVVESLREIELS